MTANARASLSEYRLNLADEVLNDIEEDRENAERLIFKAVRLADVAGDEDMKAWLECELSGYPGEIPASVEPWLAQTGRRSVARLTPAQMVTRGIEVLAEGGENLLDGAEVRINRESLPRIEEHIIPSMAEGTRQQAQRLAGIKRRKAAGIDFRLRNFDPTQWESGIQRTRVYLLQLNQISKRVRAELHAYAVATYHRFAFSDAANNIFDRHKKAVDALLRATVPDVIDKIPAIYDRLGAAPDPEAISQAMVSVRRMIAAFADAVCPPRAQPSIDEAGGEHEVTQQKVLNRIDEHLKKCESKTRRERLSKTTRALYDRVSAGVKNDVTAGEAQSLFLATYLTLGESAEATGLSA